MFTALITKPTWEVTLVFHVKKIWRKWEAWKDETLEIWSKQFPPIFLKKFAKIVDVLEVEQATHNAPRFPFAIYHQFTGNLISIFFFQKIIHYYLFYLFLFKLSFYFSLLFHIYFINFYFKNDKEDRQTLCIHICDINF